MIFIYIGVLLFFILMTIFLGWYSVISAKKLNYLSINLERIFILIDAYKTHINSVNEAEEYMGDPTLMAIVKHSNVVLEQLDYIIGNSDILDTESLVDELDDIAYGDDNEEEEDLKNNAETTNNG